MKLLFSMRHVGYVRYYESVLDALLARGHEVVVAAEQRELGESFDTSRLAARFRGVTWMESAEPSPSIWAVLARCVRMWLDFLRFSEAAYSRAPKYRARVEAKMPAGLARLARVQATVLPWLSACMAQVLRAIERALPTNPALDAFLIDQQPDVVLLTPLVYLGSSQVDILRSARRLGMRTGVCIASWDHLSSKSFIRELPDRVFVWNATQQHEAEHLHRVPASRIVVTGAQCFDHWFDRSPSRTREQFCADAGLVPDRPFVLYVCSALLVNSPPERDLVEAWIRELRADASPVRDLGILVRPHPNRTREWEGIEWSDENVVVWGSNPIEEVGKDDYFDSLYYASAIVGINTSAFLEAAILGKPILAVVVPAFQDNQEGTLHFHYLTDIAGGVLRVARSFREHVEQLRVELETVSAPSRHGDFLTSFIRPYGVGKPATATFVEQVAQLAAAPRPQPAASSHVARVLVYPLALMARAAFENALLRIDRALRKDRLRRLRAERLDALRRHEAVLERRSAAEYQAVVRRRQAARRARLAERQRIREEQERTHAERRREKELQKQARWADKRRREREMLRARLLQRIKRRMQVIFGRGEAL